MITRRLPPVAVLLGLGGLIPFVGCGLVALWSRDPVLATRLLQALVAYGAVILSFLGAVHWGFAMADESRLAATPRLVLGVLPAIFGWIALLVLQQGQADAALAILALAFGSVLVVEQRASSRGLMPPRYINLRWVLTIVVVATLIAVLMVRVGERLHA